MFLTSGKGMVTVYPVPFGDFHDTRASFSSPSSLIYDIISPTGSQSLKDNSILQDELHGPISTFCIHIRKSLKTRALDHSAKKLPGRGEVTPPPDMSSLTKADLSLFPGETHSTLSPGERTALFMAMFLWLF